jgi:delta(3,5)-delta(2,4)-dienoyl-CoA isomerase
MAADVGTLQRFPKVVGNQSLARELCYTARNFSAEEALHLGLVSKVLSNQQSAKGLTRYFFECAKQ